MQNIFTTFNSKIICHPFHCHLHINFSLKQVFTIHCFYMFQPQNGNIQWLKQEQANCAASWKWKFMCLYAITLHNFTLKHFSFLLTHIIIYLSVIHNKCSENVGLVKCSVLLTNVNHNCNAINLTLYMDIKWDSWQVIQKGYNTIS